MRLTDFYGSSEILSASLTSFILATEKKNLGVFNKCSLYQFPFYDVYYVFFAAFKLVIVLA